METELWCREHNCKVHKIKVRDQTIEFCTVCSKWIIFELLGYKVYHKEVERFHNSTARVKTCWAPRRTTKSYSAAHDMLVSCMLPNTINWIVGPSYGIAEKEFRVVKEQLVDNSKKLGIEKPLVCRHSAASGNLYIKWPWGAVLEGKSCDRKNSLLGEATDIVLYSEAAQMTQDIRERYIMQTTVTRKGVEIIPTTPFQSAEWVYDLCMKGQSGKFPGYESFHWDITANPEYEREEFERAKKFLGKDSPAFREQYLGEWVFYGGAVYNSFDPGLHVIEPFDIPSSWKRIRAIDFGHRDPFVCLWAAVGPSQELYFYREYYERNGLSMKEHAQNIKRMSAGEHISTTVADPSGLQSIEDLSHEGIYCDGANNDREAGRLRVLDYLFPCIDGVKPFNLKYSGGTRDKWARAYFFENMKELQREIRYYRFNESKKKEAEKEVTQGEDHAMDTLRYLIMTRPSPYQIRQKVAPGSFNGVMNRIKEDTFYNEMMQG